MKVQVRRPASILYMFLRSIKMYINTGAQKADVCVLETAVLYDIAACGFMHFFRDRAFYFYLQEEERR